MTELFTLKDLTPPTHKNKSSSKNTRAKRFKSAQGERYKRCKEVIGEIEQNQIIHFASAGEWSSHNLLFHLLAQTGPAAVHIASWSITEDPCRMLINGLNNGQITALHLLFDWRVKIRCPAAAALAKHNASSCYLTSCHAKTTVITNDKWQIAIVGSANYTNNPRIEAGIIHASETAATFHRQWITACISNADPFEMERTTKQRIRKR